MNEWDEMQYLITGFVVFITALAMVAVVVFVSIGLSIILTGG